MYVIWLSPRITYSRPPSSHTFFRGAFQPLGKRAQVCDHSLSAYIYIFILLYTFFQFYSVVNRDSKVDNFANSLFLLLIIIRSGLLAEIRWSVWMSKSHRSLCVSFSRTGAGLCIYHLFVWYYYYFSLVKLFTSALTGSFSLEFELQQFSLGLQDSSEYSSKFANIHD